jgi:hypothetical protein
MKSRLKPQQESDEACIPKIFSPSSITAIRKKHKYVLRIKSYSI